MSKCWTIQHLPGSAFCACSASIIENHGLCCLSVAGVAAGVLVKRHVQCTKLAACKLSGLDNAQLVAALMFSFQVRCLAPVFIAGTG